MEMKEVKNGNRNGNGNKGGVYGNGTCMLELYKNLIDLNPLSCSPLFIFNVNTIQ